MDVKKIDELAQLMQRRGLNKVRLEEEDGSAVVLERAMGVPVEQPALVEHISVPLVEPVPAPPAVDEVPDDGAAAVEDADVTEVPAPMVGVFYVAPSPGAKPFVHVGSKVHKGDTLCIIEAMKLMNEVRAECDGEIVEVCAEDGELVEYGSCLMKIR